jgi:ferredoxin
LKISKVPRVNKGECISCGVCVDAAAIQEAIDLCPVICIYWDEGE